MQPAPTAKNNLFPHLGAATPTTPSGYVKLTQRLELLQLRYPLPFP